MSYTRRFPVASVTVWVSVWHPTPLASTLLVCIGLPEVPETPESMLNYLYRELRDPPGR
jgi:hypothetical protein